MTKLKNVNVLKQTKMDRAIKIIEREIEKRKSMMMQKEHFLRLNELKFEVKSLDKALIKLKN